MEKHVPAQSNILLFFNAKTGKSKRNPSINSAISKSVGYCLGVSDVQYPKLYADL